MAEPKASWPSRDWLLRFRKPKARPALSGDARAAAWKATSLESKSALAGLRSKAGIRRDVAPHAWKDLQASSVEARKSLERRARKGS